MSFNVLPTEVLQIIFSFQTWQDQKAIGLVCRRWAAAVEPLLLARTRLKVSFRKEDFLEDDLLDNTTEYGLVMASIGVINKSLLINSNRNYTCLRLEWDDVRNGQSFMDFRGFLEGLDICLERFSVQRLYLRGPPGEALADVFVRQQKWSETLTELYLELCSTWYSQPALSFTIEVSLPKLKLLTWLESRGYEKHGLRHKPPRNLELRHELNETFDFHVDINTLYATLDVPELDRLKVRVKGNNAAGPINLSGHLDVKCANDCCLFLPSLHLKSCSKIQYVEILDLNDLDESVFNHSGVFLQSLRSLALFKCEYETIEMICGKCSNLEELIINEPVDKEGFWSPALPFHISTVLSHSLKKLTLGNFKKSFNEEEAIFPELRHLHLIHMGQAFYRSVTLIAPKLTTLVTSRSDYDRLKITHKDQIRTMVVELNSWTEDDSIPPPPNVTELVLRQTQIFGNQQVWWTMVKDYFKYYSNLKRLTFIGFAYFGRAELDEGFIQRNPDLEYLWARDLYLRLADFHELKHLKSLTLIDCTMLAEPDERAVTPTSLEYFRIHQVCSEWAEGQFPIRASDRQPPVVKEKGVFSSPNFQLQNCKCTTMKRTCTEHLTSDY